MLGVARQAGRVTPYLDAPWPLAFAHRGGAAEGVENGLSAFAAVQRLGYRYVETDIRTTADGVPVVFHDADTSRLTGEAGRVEDLPLAAVRELALAEGERVATLEEVLDAFPGLRFNIDLKDAGGASAPCPAVLARTGAGRRVCVTSFAHRRVRAGPAAALGPEVCTGLGVGRRGGGPRRPGRPGPGAGRPGGAAAVVAGGRAHGCRPRCSGSRNGRGWRCTSGRSTTRPRWQRRSTSGSTAS